MRCLTAVHPSGVWEPQAQVLRRYALSAELDAARGAQALEDLAALPLSRYPHDVLLPRIWELRHSITAYDAAYVALSEALAAPLVTRDAALAAKTATPMPTSERVRKGGGKQIRCAKNESQTGK